MSDLFGQDELLSTGRGSSFLKPTSTFLTQPRKKSLFGLEFPQTLESKITDQENLARAHHIPIPGEQQTLRIWDLLNWARYPITNMIYTASKEWKEDSLGWEDTGKILKSAVYGAILKERRNTEDVLKVLFPNLKPWQYTVFGMAGDAISDPLTWVSFGGAAAGKAGLVAAGEGRVAAETLAKGITKEGAELAAKEGVQSVAYQAFEKGLMAKFGGRTADEALNLARRAEMLKFTKPGLNIRVPFTNIQKQIIPGSRADILAGIVGKMGAPAGAVQAIREAPVRIQSLKPVASLAKMFQPAAKLGAYAPAHDIELAKMGEHTARARNMGHMLEGVTLDVDKAIQNPSIELQLALRTGGKKTVYGQRGTVLDYVRDALEQKIKLPPELEPIAQKIRNVTDQAWGELVQRGLLKKEQYIEQYFPRYWVKKETGEIRIIGIPSNSIEARFLNHRVLKTAEEAKELGFNVMPTADSLRVYLGSVNKMLTSYDTIKDMAVQYGKKITGEEAKAIKALVKESKTHETISDVLAKRFGEKYVRLTHKGFRDVVVPMQIGNVLNKIDLVLNEEDELRKIIGFANKVQTGWKKAATIYWPGFQMRNEASNIWTGVFKDGIGPRQLGNYARADKIFRNPYSDELIRIFDPVQGKYVRKSLRLVNEKMMREGIHTGGFFATELPDVIRKLSPLEQMGEKGGARGIIGAIGKAERAATKIGAGAGSYFENTARIASALNDLDIGLPWREVARRVNLAFINYQDITQVEKKIRNLIPFWSWFKNNFANQLNYIVEDPGKYMMYTTRPLKAINWAKEETKQYMPEWAKAGQYVQPFGAQFRGVPLALNPNLPFQDIGELDIKHPLSSIAGMIGERVTPFIKTPIELAMNKSLFTGQPIAHEKYSTEKVPPLLEPVIMALPEQARMRLGIVKTEMGWEMPAKWVYALMTMVPQAKIGQPVQTLFKPEAPQYRGRQAPFDILSRTTGAKLKPLDIGYYKEKALKQRLGELKQLTSKYIP
jgi:hypothetical protein